MLSFSDLYIFLKFGEATVAQQAEQLICNQRVGGSIPFGGSMERFPSGQREQTVNLPAKPSEVRILPSPPCKFKSKILKLWLSVNSELIKLKILIMLKFNFSLMTIH